MAIETLPEPSIPVTTPFRPGLGFLTATPIIAAATIWHVIWEQAASATMPIAAPKRKPAARAHER